MEIVDKLYSPSTFFSFSPIVILTANTFVSILLGGINVGVIIVKSIGFRYIYKFWDMRHIGCVFGLAFVDITPAYSFFLGTQHDTPCALTCIFQTE